MKILVTGKKGQLAVSLVEAAGLVPGVELVTVGRPELDLSDAASVTDVILAHQPDIAGAILEADQVRAFVAEPRQRIGLQHRVVAVIDHDADADEQRKLRALLRYVLRRRVEVGILRASR